MTDSTPSEPTPEDGEPASFAEKTKDWVKKHKKMILAVGAGVVVVGVVVRHAMAKNVTECAEGSEPLFAPETTDRSRQSSIDHDRDPFLRRLPAGQQASEAARARYRELTGNDLPPGYTLVRRWFFLSPEDETPGEAAA
ncbi:hypothetical protein ACFTZI_16650 [Streptomyces decoyicus]|uniref:hypothetical protein n=1 Tax=Streptomyces decoyicus TaxID=249567 RepID=UPI0036362162